MLQNVHLIFVSFANSQILVQNVYSIFCFSFQLPYRLFLILHFRKPEDNWRVGRNIDILDYTVLIWEVFYSTGCRLLF